MKPLSAYSIIKDDWTCYNSKLCSVACSLGNISEFSKLDNRINELVQSFFNQWQFVVITYDKLYNLLHSLNKNSDAHKNIGEFSEYDIESANAEIDFRSYSYLLIVNMKSYMDLFSCIVDIVINQEIRKEKELPHFSSFGKSKQGGMISDIRSEFNSLRDASKYPWIALIADIRNRIIHRGYHLKPLFGFKKYNELNIRMYKGTDMYKDVVNFEIGKLFDDFMTEMPIIEENVSNILLTTNEYLNNRLTVYASFQYSGWINRYNFTETEEPQ